MALFTKSIKHPKEFSIIQGSTQYVDEFESINQSIKLILTTAKGELYGDPEFGTNLYLYLYDYSGAALNQMIRNEIVDCLNRWEPRIFVNTDDIEIEEDNLTLKINIPYNIRYTDYATSYSLLIQSRKEET